MFCELDNVKVYYECYGEGFPILMIHGFSPDHRLMTGCMEPIFKHHPGWKRIYLDLPGMGKTAGEDWIDSSDKMLDVVLSFADAVLPNQSYVVAGESYGGYLARGIINKRPALVAGLLLICPCIIAEPHGRTLPEPLTLVEDPVLMAQLPEAAAEEFASIAVVQSSKHWERFRDEILVGLEVADAPFLRRLRKAYAFSFDVDALPKPFTGPTLILTGRQDTFVGYQDAWKIIETYPRATFAVLDKAGHDFQIEQSEIFGVLVSEWLDRVETERMRKRT